jgi:putative glutamine amidotransferase
MRALIAVPGQSLGPGQAKDWTDASVAMPARYIQALHRAGGLEAILLPERIDAREADRRLERFDGLLLIGGGDVDPAHYGEDPLPECYGIDTESDLFEMRLLVAAMARGVPVLAICRGIQVLNVALGGTLDQHITGRRGLMNHGDPKGSYATHAVRLEQGSWVAKAMSGETAEVASSHHQALGTLGKGLRPVGWSDDGLIEAVEHEDGSWLLGVQWHPERTAATDPAQQGLFGTLVERSAGKR